MLPCVLLLLFPAFLFAAETGGRITSVSIIGLKRTKPGAAEKPLKRFIGVDADTLDIDSVKAAVMATGVLEPLSVDIAVLGPKEDSNLELTVTVREKWSVFPLPIVMGGSGGWSFGGFFVDTNALGLTDKFFLGGMYSRESWMVTGGYMHVPLAENAPGWRLMSMFAREERHDTDESNHDLRVFDLDAIRFSAGVSKTYFDTLEAGVDVSFEEMILHDRDEAFRGPTEGGRYLGFGAGLSMNQNDWDGYLLSQSGASLDYTYTLGLGCDSYHSVSFRGNWDAPLLPGFHFKLRGGGIWSPGAPVLQESPPQTAGVNILPPDYSARHYAGGQAGFEKYIFKFPVGTLSILGFWQMVFSSGSVIGSRFDQGAAAGVSFYLSRIAIPAFAILGTYNVTAGYFQMSFSLGMSF
jgi:outer membrane protein assembly factor BamA